VSIEDRGRAIEISWERLPPSRVEPSSSLPALPQQGHTLRPRARPFALRPCSERDATSLDTLVREPRRTSLRRSSAEQVFRCGALASVHEAGPGREGGAAHTEAGAPLEETTHADEGPLVLVPSARRPRGPSPVGRCEGVPPCRRSRFDRAFAAVCDTRQASTDRGADGA